MRKIFLTISILAVFSTLLYALGSLNFQMPNWSFSSGSGEVSSDSYVSKVTVGENSAGILSSESYSSGVGYITILTGTETNTAKSTLDDVYVYPNPYKPNSGGNYAAEYLTFANLTQNADIKIFNIAGELVAEIDKNSASDEYQWDATNCSGKKLGSAVYIFMIENSAGNKKSGKFSIIR